MNRRALLSTAAAGLCVPLGGCLSGGPDPDSLRRALSGTLSVSKRDRTLLVCTSPDFEHDLLVAEPAGGSVLALPGLEAATSALAPRQSVRFLARERGSDREYTHLATYTEPLAGVDYYPREPTASVRFERLADGAVTCVLDSIPPEMTARVAFPDDRPDAVLLWAGHRTTATGLPDGAVRVFASNDDWERQVASVPLPTVSGRVGERARGASRPDAARRLTTPRTRRA